MPILSQINLFQTPFHFLNINFNIILPFTPGSSKWSLSFGFPNQNPACTSPLPICVTCPDPLIRLDLIILIIFVEEYRSLSSSLCSFLHSPVTSSLLAQILSSAPYSQTPSAYVPPSMSATKFHTHTKQQAKL